MKKNSFRRFRLVKGVRNSTKSQQSREGGVRGVLNLESTCCMLINPPYLSLSKSCTPPLVITLIKKLQRKSLRYGNKEKYPLKTYTIKCLPVSNFCRQMESRVSLIILPVIIISELIIMKFFMSNIDRIYNTIDFCLQIGWFIIIN